MNGPVRTSFNDGQVTQVSVDMPRFKSRASALDAVKRHSAKAVKNFIVISLPSLAQNALGVWRISGRGDYVLMRSLFGS
jgi:hypothetical protein